MNPPLPRGLVHLGGCHSASASVALDVSHHPRWRQLRCVALRNASEIGIEAPKCWFFIISSYVGLNQHTIKNGSLECAIHLTCILPPSQSTRLQHKTIALHFLHRPNVFPELQAPSHLLQIQSLHPGSEQLIHQQITQGHVQCQECNTESCLPQKSISTGGYLHCQFLGCSQSTQASAANKCSDQGKSLRRNWSFVYFCLPLLLSGERH